MRAGLSLLIMAVATAALARPDPAPAGGPPGQGLFISPSGEPFRGAGGLGRWFVAADLNGDGAIDQAEFQSDALRFFAVLDANHDQVLDGFEIQAYERKVAPEIADTVFSFDRTNTREEGDAVSRTMGRDRASRRAMSGLQGAARFSLINEPHPVAGADLDADARVTLAEWTRRTSRRFMLLDRAGTGRLTPGALPPLPGARSSGDRRFQARD